MCYYEKTILSSYYRIDEYIEDCEKAVTYRALTSYSTKESTMTQIDKIINLIYAKNRLCDLKSKLNGIFSKFTQDETDCIRYKYYHVKPREDFDYTSRNYFRKQLRILKKISLMLEKKKMDEKWFCENYADIYFLKSIFERQKRKAEREAIYLKLKAASKGQKIESGQDFLKKQLQENAQDFSNKQLEQTSQDYQTPQKSDLEKSNSDSPVKKIA